MKNWTHIRTKPQLEKAYRSIMPTIKKIALKYGYTAAFHGSFRRDLDVVLVPWVKNAKKPESVFMALEKEFCDYSHMRKWVYKELRRSNKPHGRLACTTIVGRLARDFKGYSLGKRQTHAFIDVSIIPCLPR